MKEPVPFDQTSSKTKIIYCPLFKNKIHCSEIDGTESSKLPPHLKEEFCKKRCPIYKMRQRSNEDS